MIYNYLAIFTAFGVSYLIRVLPLTLIRKPIKNRFIRSFLYYVPYVTLAVMTFPAIVQATQSPIAGIIALVIGIILSFFGAGLFPVACVSCGVVFVSELFVLIRKRLIEMFFNMLVLMPVDATLKRFFEPSVWGFK